jgi:predicted O-methyltransferase YrrM
MSLYHAASMIRHYLMLWNSAGFRAPDPFIVKFYATVVRGNTPDDFVHASEELRREMLNDNRWVRVTDLGTGGWGSRERRLCDIASRAAVPPRQGAMLARIAAAAMADTNAEDNAIIELGTSLGISTLCLAAAAPQNRLITIEGCPALSELAKENFCRYGYENIRQINDDFRNALEKLKKEGVRAGFAYIDGNHTGDALREYFNTLMDMSGEKMTIVADDIHLNRSMYKGWQSIKHDKRIAVSVELSHFGLLFKNNQPLQDASISGVNKNYFRIKG